jgi:5'-nucleotidase
VASSALFDLVESDSVFRHEGPEAYEQFQQENLDVPLGPGVGFPFIKRLLSLNDLAEDEDDFPVEVIVLSRNSAKTGLRVMKSIEHHKLGITRSIFTEGQSPYAYAGPLNMSLFLSANRADVIAAMRSGLPAGQVQDGTFDDDPDDLQLRIAFDFDGVLADDEAERVFAERGLDAFQVLEQDLAQVDHGEGPLKRFLAEVSKIQAWEMKLNEGHSSYNPRFRIAVITARGAPAYERAINTLAKWDVVVNDAFFLGGVDKGLIAQVLRPHIYFDDQQRHLRSTSEFAPSVWVPFGVRNEDEIT